MNSHTPPHHSLPLLPPSNCYCSWFWRSPPPIYPLPLSPLWSLWADLLCWDPWHLKFTLHIKQVWETESEMQTHRAKKKKKKRNDRGAQWGIHDFALTEGKCWFLPSQKFKQHAAQWKPVSAAIICCPFLQNLWSHIAMGAPRKAHIYSLLFNAWEVIYY